MKEETNAPELRKVEAVDLFDPSRLRISQDFESEIGVKKALLTVPVHKPSRQWFVRVHPDQEFRLNTAILEIKEDREVYLVDPDLASQLPGEVRACCLFTAINRQGAVFLWNVTLPDPNGRRNEWARSALEAANMAMYDWIRVVANMNLGAYEVSVSQAKLPEPQWPESVTFKKLLEVAFRDRFIRDGDHPILKRLRGEV